MQSLGWKFSNNTEEEKYVQEETPVHNQIKTPEILKNTVFSVNLTLPLLKKKKNSQQNNPADQTDSLQLAFSYMNRIYCWKRQRKTYWMVEPEGSLYALAGTLQ